MELIQYVANRLAARDFELTGCVMDEDAYLDLAETAIRAIAEKGTIQQILEETEPSVAG